MLFGEIIFQLTINNSLFISVDMSFSVSVDMLSVGHEHKYLQSATPVPTDVPSDGKEYKDFQSAMIK